MRIVIWLFALALAAPGFTQPQYEVVDLTAKFGQFFVPIDINNKGVIVGGTGEGACVVENGVLTLLPKYKGHFWAPTEIADNGDVLGHSTLFTGIEHTLLYRDGKVIDIGIAGTSNFAAGQGLNNLGQISGGNGTNAFIWEDGKTTLLPSPFPGTALGLNDSGTAVGVMSNVGVEQFAVRWINGVFDDISPAWASDSQALEVNENGEVVGWAIANQGGYRAVLWRDGKPVDLGDFGGGIGRAYDINFASQIVGLASEANMPIEGFLWEEGVMYRLTDLIGPHPGFDWLENAFSINGQGSILTSAAGGTQVGHYLLLNPVPEPSSATTAVAGVLTICAMKRFSRNKQGRGRKSK
ncbi:MAG: DUF3466 family protein [Armatimonadota bacterium]|nr:DUF3466 family protein [Armatimonadota bacterium]